MRDKVILECTECKSRNYTAKKNKKLHPDRVEANKHCKFCKKHALHKEARWEEFMAAKNTQNSNRKPAPRSQGFLKGVKTKWNKIVWSTPKETSEYSVAVVMISFIVVSIVRGLDTVFQHLIGLFT